ASNVITSLLILLPSLCTIISYGMSTKHVFRNYPHTLVIHGYHTYVLKPLPTFSALSIIVLNLYILNTLPFLPKRSCLNNTGPFEVALIAIEVVNSIGEITIIPTKLPEKSIPLFMNLSIFFILATTF